MGELQRAARPVQPSGPLSRALRALANAPGDHGPRSGRDSRLFKTPPDDIIRGGDPGGASPVRWNDHVHRRAGGPDRRGDRSQGDLRKDGHRLLQRSRHHGGGSWPPPQGNALQGGPQRLAHRGRSAGSAGKAGQPPGGTPRSGHDRAGTGRCRRMGSPAGLRGKPLAVPPGYRSSVPPDLCSGSDPGGDGAGHRNLQVHRNPPGAGALRSGEGSG